MWQWKGVHFVQEANSAPTKTSNKCHKNYTKTMNMKKNDMTGWSFHSTQGWLDFMDGHFTICDRQLSDLSLRKQDGTCGPINGPPQPSAMPAGKLCRGGSINPEIKGCILYLDQADPDQSYLLHWVHLVQEWFNLQKPQLTAGCSHELVLLIIWDHGSLCLPISTFQNDLYKTMISKM